MEFSYFFRKQVLFQIFCVDIFIDINMFVFMFEISQTENMDPIFGLYTMLT